ncbi:calcineurin-binding protein cabin-1-like isoform X2 [Scaptodrosophila lebanonensis]|uniref:Calcineurin-binding protein cabin-1-like isoform X2 n=1 Tax=Drosophila lebanonensis TaxID=7225 RepID=A0A6J2U3V7_DROLE|nr:calcineurin-binding protein cabin-1-like isoform X2 [Scaptodrosophila lebanonensis]
MFRIVALNDIGNDKWKNDTNLNESQIANDVQESIAESEYLRGISMLSNGNKDLAYKLFVELLDTQVLNGITRKDAKMWTIRYNCYKYLALINEESKILNSALLNYVSAINMDNTDINTLFRMGQLSYKLSRYELAEYAFVSCLQQNTKHFAAAHGLLILYLNQNNLIAAYGIASKLFKNNQCSKLLDGTVYDIFHRFSSFIPYCDKLFGRIPNEAIESLDRPIFNTLHEAEPTIKPLEYETTVTNEQPEFLNLYSIGEFILLKLNYLKENHLDLPLAFSLKPVNIVEKKNSVQQISEVEDTQRYVYTEISDPSFDNVGTDIFEADMEGNDLRSDEDIEKPKPRRRCSDLRLLEQWGWHKNRKSSSRRKTQSERTEIDISLAGFLRKTFTPFLSVSPDETTIGSRIRNDQCKLCTESSTLETFLKQRSNDFQTFLKFSKEKEMDLLNLNFLWLKTISEMWSSPMPSEIKLLFMDLFLVHIILPNIWTELLNNLKFFFGCATQKNVVGLEILTYRVLNIEFLNYTANFDNKKSLELINFVVELLGTKDSNFCIHLPNLSSCCITMDRWIFRRLEIERKTKLSQIPVLFENGKWIDLCENLKEQLGIKMNIGSEPGGLLDYKNLNELLLHCLWQRAQYEDCLIYAESFLHYLTQNYLNEWNISWIDSINFAMSYIENILANEGFEMAAALLHKCSRLVQNLISILSYQFDEDVGKKLYFNDERKMRRSWMILHRVLLREETLNRNLFITGSEEDCLPLSFVLLFRAHEYIGKKQTCTSDGGEFLHFIIQAILPNLCAPIYNSCRNHTLEHIEQVTYCMYGFPPKRARSRHLEEHNSKQIALTWENALDIFFIYAPDILPEFNSYKVESITSDMEQFLQNVIKLLPGNVDMDFGTRNIKEFISGSSIKLSSKCVHLPFKIKNIFYLVADYYFKSHDFIKAITYYMDDLAVNTSRFDSWAGISLSKASIIDTKINGFQKTDPFQIILECEEVIRCFEKCIGLMQTHILIWIEYGSFAYSISSYCSRNLKKATSENAASMRYFREKQEKMMSIAYNCFSVASTLQCSESLATDTNDEKWLCHYMLGKISEKQAKHPADYLNYYLTASNYLYECSATYPIKINHNNPTTLSVEALEIFYRINAAIIKFLEKNSFITRSIGDIFKGVLKQLSKSPFAFNKAKIDGNCLYAIKRKSTDLTDINATKKLCFEITSKNVTEEEKEASHINPATEVLRRFSEESRGTGTITTSTNSSSSISIDDSESENSCNQTEFSNYNASELEHIYKKAIRNLEECVIRFPEHYKSIYRLVSFYMNGPKKMRNFQVAEDLLLHHYQTSVGNMVDGLFFYRKRNNIFNGIWRIPSSEIDRPGSFSTHLVKCINILLQLLKIQCNYKILIDIILQFQRPPETERCYIQDYDRIKLYNTAINYCQETMRNILYKHETEKNEKELLNMLLDMYKIQKKYYKYAIQKDIWFSTIFVEVYLSYIKIINALPYGDNYFDLAVKLCHQEITHKKNMEKQSSLLTNINQVSNILITEQLPCNPSNVLIENESVIFTPPAVQSGTEHMESENMHPLFQEDASIF